jgi:DNA polymerase sigma
MIDSFQATFGWVMQIKDAQNNIDIELTINKVLEVYNSKLISTYAKLDLRFLKLSILLKLWNKKSFPGSDRYKRLNSYSLTIMLIAFLQRKEILPNL